MKKETIARMARRICALCALLVCMGAQAVAMDAATAADWMEQFAAALDALSPVNDPAQTGDPARAGQYLLEYEFGTVLAGVSEHPAAQDIIEIDVRTSQVTDCRGVRVGMALDAALSGESLGAAGVTGSQLYVLGTQDTGYGFSWAYVGADGVYGVEYITYAGQESGMKEYTLTYVLGDGEITAIRVKTADATLVQAQDAVSTAQEMLARQQSELIASKNAQAIFAESDLQVMGGDALGVPVAQLIRLLGEPQSVQTLPSAQGRMLVYDGAVVRLSLNEATGEEIVRGVSVSSAAIEGPRRLTVGMSAQAAAGLFACTADTGSRGGTLYLEGEAAGEAPYGELTALSADELLLRYACVTSAGETAVLEAGVKDGAVAYWSLAYAGDAEGGM